jgi:hypothetical protein
MRLKELALTGITFSQDQELSHQLSPAFLLRLSHAVAVAVVQGQLAVAVVQVN